MKIVFDCVDKLSLFLSIIISPRYLHDREKPLDATANIKRLLTYLKNLPLKRKIAMELGLTDVVQSISATFDEGFLNDLARL